MYPPLEPRIKIPFFVNGSKDPLVSSVLRRMSNGKADAFAEELEHALHIKEQEQVRVWVHPGGWDGLGGRERGGEKWRGQRGREREREGERGRMCLVLALTDLHSNPNLRSLQSARFTATKCWCS